MRTPGKITTSPVDVALRGSRRGSGATVPLKLRTVPIATPFDQFRPDDAPRSMADARAITRPNLGEGKVNSPLHQYGTFHEILSLRLACPQRQSGRGRSGESRQDVSGNLLDKLVAIQPIRPIRRSGIENRSSALEDSEDRVSVCQA